MRTPRRCTKSTEHPDVDALFAEIERVRAGRPWGDVLDAGTGGQSLSWIRGLDAQSWTAVTADPNRAATMRLQHGQPHGVGP